MSRERRARLASQTARWRDRRDARRPGVEGRPPASAEREALAARAFPFRTVSAADYVARHGDDMIGFVYDEARYADPALDAWLLAVGRILRERRNA